ncbi:MAG: hypothetical protein FVQ77_16100 [Cytophagales bacterium]|nr:hypothetical protein [Cytophagales bacterium]
MKLEEAKIKYKGQWIAFRAFDESDNPEGRVILHGKDRKDFYKKLIEQGITDVYLTFAGPLTQKAMVLCFFT